MNPDESRNGSRSSRFAAPYLQALALFAAYALGYPWLASWCSLHLPARPGSWLFLEATTLGGVVLLVVAFGRGAFTACGAPAGRPRGDGMLVALQALFLLGVLALALRVVDPAYDDREFSLRSLETPAALLEFLAVLPFGIAAEELIFRSCQKRLRLILRPAPAIVAVALGFAAFHWVPWTPLDGHQVETLLGTFAGGLLLAWAYERTASVRLLIAIHLVYDGLAVGQTWMHVGRARAAEAALFIVWLAATGGLAAARSGLWRGGSILTGVAPAGEPVPDRPPEPATQRVAGWMAAAVFGCGVPLLLAWIRIRLGF